LPSFVTQLNPLVQVQAWILINFGRNTVETDAGQERFAGTLPGVELEFKPRITARDIGCPEKSAVEDASETLLADSPLRITPSYQPPSYTRTGEGAGACAGKVVSVGRHYAGPDGGDIILPGSAGEPCRAMPHWTA